MYIGAYNDSVIRMFHNPKTFYWVPSCSDNRGVTVGVYLSEKRSMQTVVRDPQNHQIKVYFIACVKGDRGTTQCDKKVRTHYWQVLVLDNKGRVIEVSRLVLKTVTCRRSVVSSGYSGFLHQKTDFIIIPPP